MDKAGMLQICTVEKLRCRHNLLHLSLVSVLKVVIVLKNEELGVSREVYGAYRMDSADERQGRQVYEDSTSLG